MSHQYKSDENNLVSLSTHRVSFLQLHTVGDRVDVKIGIFTIQRLWVRTLASYVAGRLNILVTGNFLLYVMDRSAGHI